MTGYMGLPEVYSCRVLVPAAMLYVYFSMPWVISLMAE
jgi:hypothetical protein